MKNSYTVEIIYFFTALLISVVAFHFLFNLTNIGTESVVDVYIQDTNSVIEKKELLPIFCLVIVYLVYLSRVFYQKFKNRQTLRILSSVSLILILVWPTILSFVKIYAVEPGWVVYPPLSAGKVEIEENNYNKLYPIIYFTFFITTILGIFCFYKLGRLHKQVSF